MVDNFKIASNSIFLYIQMPVVISQHHPGFCLDVREWKAGEQKLVIER